MDNPNNSTEHRKGQHLTSEERHDIEVHLKDGWSKYRIARHLNRPYNTIKTRFSAERSHCITAKCFGIKLMPDSSNIRRTVAVPLESIAVLR